MKQNSFHQNTISDMTRRKGSVANKVPVVINDTTVIYVTPGKEEEARAKYTAHINRFHWIDPSGNMVR